MKIIVYCILVLFYLTLAACSGAQNQVEIMMPETLDDVLAIALTRRESIARPTYDRLVQVTEGRTALMIDPFELRRCLRHHVGEEISANDALHDTYILFKALAGAYGAYIYFGGDEVFLPVKSEIIDVINTRKTWTPQALTELFHAKLSQVISDGHFYIGDMSLQANYQFFTYSGRFYGSGNRFMCGVSGLYVRELLLPCLPDFILELNDTFRLSICESGNGLFYTPVVVLRINAEEVGPYELKIIYDDGTTDVVPLRALVPECCGNLDAPPSLNFIDCVPVVSVRWMGNPVGIHTPNVHARLFLEYAYELSKEPVLILDLRCNMGGYGNLPEKWFYNLTGEIISPNRHYLRLTGFDSHWELLYGLDSFMHEAMLPFDDNHSIADTSPDIVTSSNQLIIVLIDRRTVSAAEIMTDLAFSMENTLVIGQNTGGFLLSNVHRIHLRRSNMNIHMGFGLSVFHEDHFQEGIGFAPDIWVTGDALTAALGMLRTHFSEE